MNVIVIHKFNLAIIFNYFSMIFAKAKLHHLMVFLIREKKKKESLFYNDEDLITLNFEFFQKYL